MPFSDGCAGAAPGADVQSCAGGHPAPSKPETGNILMFFPFVLLEWLHRISLLVPTLLLSNYFQPQRSSADIVTGFFCMWLIFLPPPPFFLLNKHAHFPIFPSPNSLASFPLHKRCQETRSVKQCAAFLNNCVTAWNGTCESFKKPQCALKVSQKKGNKTSPNKITKVLQIPVFQLRFTQVSPTKPEVSPETFCSGVSSAKISRKGWESTGLTGTSLSRLTRSYPPLTIEGNEQWGTEEAFGMDPSLMNRGGENSQELKGVKESQVKLSFQEDNDLRKSSGDLPSGGPSAAQVTSH